MYSFKMYQLFFMISLSIIFIIFGISTKLIEAKPNPLPIANPSAFWDLFGQSEPSRGSYGNSYRSNSRRTNSRGREIRYGQTCRLHAGNAAAFPGNVHNPVCPY